MKKLVLSFLLIGFLFSCNIRNSKNNPESLANMDVSFTDTTSVQLVDSVYDFGKTTEGTKVSHDFEFRNTGKKPLVIFSAKASCGCTVPEKPQEPVKPGETGIIKVVFNTASHPGPAHKTIVVASNAYPPFPVLLVTGVVDKKN
ncbi:MAG: DUF1573 domain-containing protein [Ginsengibacter sp.]